jgi:hypothetical protein
MPTIARIGPYRVFFYSKEDFHPPHVHIERDDSVAKFWLDPVDLASSRDFPTHELNKLWDLVVEKQETWLQEWYERHGNTSASN